MSEYRSKELPELIAQAEFKLKKMMQVKHWLDRGIFEIGYDEHDSNHNEKTFANTVLSLVQLDKDTYHFKEGIEHFYSLFLNKSFTKEELILVNAFLEDVFDGMNLKKIKEVK